MTYFDQYLIKVEKRLFNNQYIVFGAGKSGINFYEDFKDKICVDFFVDNDKDMTSKMIDGKKIFHPNTLINGTKHTIIIASDIHNLSIKRQLEGMGFVYEEDFFFHRKFNTLFSWIKEQKVYITNTNIPITYKCTLKCKYCGSFIPYHKEPQHRNINEIKEDIRMYFNLVDKVAEFDVIGGEPLLHPYLKDIIKFIMENYSRKINRLQVVTNATCSLEADLIAILKKYNVIVGISDYSKNVPVGDKVRRFVDILQENLINHNELKMEYWLDMGTPPGHQQDHHDLKEFFRQCNNLCRALLNKKFFYCSIEAFAVAANYFKEQKQDVFNLENIECNDKKKLVEFELGMISQECVSYCKCCKGYVNVNSCLVKAGEQV